MSLEETGPVKCLPTDGAGQHCLLLRSPAWTSPGHGQVMVGGRGGGEQEGGGGGARQEEAQRRRRRRDQREEVVVVVAGGLQAGVEQGRDQPGQGGRGGTGRGLEVEEPGGQQ